MCGAISAQAGKEGLYREVSFKIPLRESWDKGILGRGNGKHEAPQVGKNPALSRAPGS